VLYLRTWAEVLEEQLALAERDAPERSGEHTIADVAPLFDRKLA
jgi:hypothetical protein